MIRRLTPGDAVSFARLRLLGLEMHPEAFGTSADAWREASDEQRSAALSPGDEPADQFVLGAFEDDELVGVLGFKRERRESVRHKGSLWGLFVHPDHRRAGIGGRLIRAAIDEVRGCEGLEYLRLVASTASREAVRLFTFEGFVRYGLETGGLRAAGESHDQAFLRRDVVLARRGSTTDR